MSETGMSQQGLRPDGGFGQTCPCRACRSTGRLVRLDRLSISCLQDTMVDSARSQSIGGKALGMEQSPSIWQGTWSNYQNIGRILPRRARLHSLTFRPNSGTQDLHLHVTLSVRKLRTKRKVQVSLKSRIALQPKWPPRYRVWVVNTLPKLTSSVRFVTNPTRTSATQVQTSVRSVNSRWSRPWMHISLSNTPFPVSELSKQFVGYFDPECIFFYNENK